MAALNLMATLVLITTACAIATRGHPDHDNSMHASAFRSNGHIHDHSQEHSAPSTQLELQHQQHSHPAAAPPHSTLEQPELAFTSDGSSAHDRHHDEARRLALHQVFDVLAAEYSAMSEHEKQVLHGKAESFVASPTPIDSADERRRRLFAFTPFGHFAEFVTVKFGAANTRAESKEAEEEAERERNGLNGLAFSIDSSSSEEAEAAQVEARNQALRAYGAGSTTDPPTTSTEATLKPTSTPPPTSTQHPYLAGIEW